VSRQVRGILFVDYVRMLRSRKVLDGARRFLLPEDEPFLRERLDVNAWYPMATFERLGLAILNEIVGLEVDSIRLWGRSQIAALLTFFPDLAAAGDPRDAVMRLQNFMLSLFDFPALVVESVDDEGTIIEVSYGMSAPAEAAATWQTIGFFEELVIASGGREVRCELRGDRFTLQWSLGPPEQGPLVNPRVLLVDDEPLVLMALERSLRQTATVTVAGSLPEARALLELEVFDALVADHYMGSEGTGVELLTEASQRWPRMRRILHSGSPPPVDTLLTLGIIHEVLVKPAQPDLMRRAVCTPAPAS
jgi:CheY-like chemotaxis protein